MSINEVAYIKSFQYVVALSKWLLLYLCADSREVLFWLSGIILKETLT